ncbi:MAG: response regulator transcription factor [Candidatus Omnitrophota bacterium]|nr:response regulator transcription factor [Candidatus Omnitrophota bacterium]
MEEKLIVIVDDELDMIEELKESLAPKGLRVKGFEGSKGLFDFLNRTKDLPDLIVLDLTLPEEEGSDICRELKRAERFGLIPVIVLSGRSGEADKVFCLDIGADDYIVKPFSVAELNARINAVLRRRSVGGEEKRIEVGNKLVIDIKNYQVTVNGEKVELTPAEFKVLECLSIREGQVMTRSRILEYLWGQEKAVIGRTIDVHIRHLREKLGEAGNFIKNIRGIGYKIEA